MFRVLLALFICLQFWPAWGETAADSDFVRVQDGKLVLHGQPFVARGANYFGSWRDNVFLSAEHGLEFGEQWTLYHNATATTLNADFDFLRRELNATVIRVAAPTQSEFQSMVQYHGYAPWYLPDGSINPDYLARLRQVVDLAYAHGIRVELCLAWNLQNEIAAHPDLFAPGAERDRFYARQVASVAEAFKDDPGLMAYSIGNEVMIKWQINGLHRSALEPRIGGFIVRRLHELRAEAPHQLLVGDETSGFGVSTWFVPNVMFAEIPDTDHVNGGKPYHLADMVDYVAPHFYPVSISRADLADHFQSKLAASRQNLTALLQAAAPFHKPVILDEIGFRIDPPNFPESLYGPFRDAFYQQILDAGQRQGLQGIVAWVPLPLAVLRPNKSSVNLSKINPYSPLEVDYTTDDGASHRALFWDPVYSLFTWGESGDEPLATAAAKALAASWPEATAR